MARGCSGNRRTPLALTPMPIPGLPCADQRGQGRRDQPGRARAAWRRWPMALVILALGLLGAAAPAHTQDLAEIECQQGQVCRNASTRLPLAVLTRPFSRLHDAPSDSAAGAEATGGTEVPAFRRLFVFARQDVDYSDPTRPAGWYQVGATINRPNGWMRAADVLEWHQALIVSYTHPGSGDFTRTPVLGFDSLASLKAVIEAGEERQAEVEDRMSDLIAGTPPADVVTLEPQDVFLDINETFYLFPVLSWEPVRLFDREGRYLQLISAVPGARATGDEFTTANPEYLTQAINQGPAIAVGGLQTAAPPPADLVVDIVFVIDLTGSMEPFVQGIISALQSVPMLVSQGNQARIRFGLVGYRDDVNRLPDIEFTTRNFTPELQDAESFVSTLTSQVTVYGGGDYEEEVFAGMRDALEQTAWSTPTGQGVRLIVLVGDASSHPAGSPLNTTGLDADGVRDLADVQDVVVLALHVQDPRAPDDHVKAREQFQAMAVNPGDQMPAYLAIPADQPDQYEIAVRNIADRIAQVVNAAAGGAGAAASPAPAPAEVQPMTLDGGTPAPAPAGDQDVAAAALSVTDRVLAGALVDFVGRDREAQRDVTFWVYDHDPIDTEIPALQVHLLVDREQLNNLILAVEAVHQALVEGSVTREGFFSILKSIVAGTSLGETASFETAETLAGSRLFPAWLESLPYRSPILSLSDAVVESFTPDQMNQLLTDIEALIKLYREINTNTDVWQSLSADAGTAEQVFPLPIDALP